MNEDRADDVDQPSPKSTGATVGEERAYQLGWEDGRRSEEQSARWRQQARDSDRAFLRAMWGYGLIMLAATVLFVAEKRGLLDPIFDKISREKIDA